MGPTQDNFISWWQLYVLVTGQPDKTLIDLRDSKRSRELSAVGMENLVSGVNRIVSSLVFSLCTSKCLAKVQDTAMLLLHCSPSSHLLQATITCRLVIPLLNTAFSQSVHSQILYSITSGFVATH
jgi:hypothetical protein